MVRRIQRKRVVAHIPNPLSTSALNVPDDLKTTIRGEPFYAFNSGKEDHNRFIVFSTTQNLDELEFSEKWAVDGTFAVCPSLFYQLYTMHGIIKDTTVPLVYCLMRSKTKEKYEELFAALKNLNAMLDPHDVTIDFEIAAIEALKSSFPNANIKCRFFHFAQANWQKIQNIGLAKEYQQDTDVRIILKSFVAFALIPEEDIYLGFQKIQDTTAKMQNEKIAECCELFWSYVVGREKFAREAYGGLLLALILVPTWKRQKTKNAVEGWHRAIKVSLGYVHLTIFKFIDFLRWKESAAENKLFSLQAGKEFPKNARYQKNALGIKNILEGYQNNRMSLHLMDSRTFLILFSLLIFHLYYIQFLCVNFVLKKFSFESCVFESYGFWENEGIVDFLWRLLATSQSASQNINMTGCSLIQETLSLMRSEVHLDYELANPLEKRSKPVTRNQCPR